jgi:hypothetical protein
MNEDTGLWNYVIEFQQMRNFWNKIERGSKKEVREVMQMEIHEG